jgi:hypothetical protein
MTEEGWWGCGDPGALLNHLRDKAGARKFRLYAIACCWRFSQLLADDRTRLGLIAAEEFCEGRIREKQRAAAEQAVLAVINADLGDATKTASPVHYIALAVQQATRRNRDMWFATYQARAFVESAAGDRTGERIVHGRVLREVFGNPFRPVTFDPAWRTTDVLLLARGTYEEKAFDRMPILADALQDAGCDSADILDHLRDPQATHVRGCWALDLVLGKE